MIFILVSMSDYVLRLYIYIIYYTYIKYIYIHIYIYDGVNLRNVRLV